MWCHNGVIQMYLCYDASMDSKISPRHLSELYRGYAVSVFGRTASFGTNSPPLDRSSTTMDVRTAMKDNSSVLVRSACTMESSESFVDHRGGNLDGPAACVSVDDSWGRSNSSSSSFASQARATEKTEFHLVAVPTTTDVFTLFCEHVVAYSFRQHVRSLFDNLITTGCTHDSDSEMSSEGPRGVVEASVAFVHALVFFLETVHTHARECFPGDFALLPAAYSAVHAALQDVIYKAAEDSDKVWTYQGYVELVLSIHQLLERCRSFESHEEFCDSVDGDLRVRIGDLRMHQYLGVVDVHSLHWCLVHSPFVPCKPSGCVLRDACAAYRL